MALEQDSYYTPAQRIGRYQDIFDQMQNFPSGTKMQMMPPAQPSGPHTIRNMASALQGQQDPAMQALFSQPAPHLQQMAGDVVRPPLDMFIPQKGAAFDVMYDDALQGALSGGYRNPANANAIAKGVMSGNIKVLNPAGK